MLSPIPAGSPLGSLVFFIALLFATWPRLTFNLVLNPKNKLILRPSQVVSADSILLHPRRPHRSYLDHGGCLHTGPWAPFSMSFLWSLDCCHSELARAPFFLW